MADYVRVQAVVTHDVATQLEGDHAAGSTVLVVTDADDFEPTGGFLVADVLGLLAYTEVDVDADTITLAVPLPAGGLPDETAVALWDEDRGAVASVATVYGLLEGGEDDGQGWEGELEQGLRDRLPDGIRQGPGEVVEVDVDAETVIDVPGRSPQVDGQVVWHPHSRRTTTKTIGSSSGGVINHVKINGWGDIETDGITFATATWTIQYPGWYEMRLSGQWSSNPTGHRRLRFLLNGALYDVLVVGADPDDDTYMTLITQARLVEGDQVNAWAEQNSGGGLTLTTSVDIYRLSV